jgi:hypothetical protein
MNGGVGSNLTATVVCRQVPLRSYAPACPRACRQSAAGRPQNELGGIRSRSTSGIISSARP